MSTPSHPSPPPSGGAVAVPSGEVAVPGADDRVLARVLRWVRLATMAMLVLLAGTVWRDAWPVPGVDAGLAVTFMVLWLAATNTCGARTTGRATARSRRCSPTSRWPWP